MFPLLKKLSTHIDKTIRELNESIHKEAGKS